MNNLLSGKLTSRGNLNGNVNTIVYAHNYNDLSNKPTINNVTLQGNKTASDLGLATPSDITVTSVNDQTGDVVLSGSDIDYSVGMSLNAKIDDLESQIQGSGVQSVNGMTGNVTLTSNDINYSTGVTIKNKIDAVEGEIPDIYVSSVNGNSGAVTLTGSDIIYSGVQSVNGAIDSLSEELSGITAEEIPMSGTDSTPIATAVGDLSTLTTTDKSSIVGAVNEVNGNKADKSQMFKVVQFPNSSSISVAANGAVNITANDMNISAQTGYTPVAIVSVYTTSNEGIFRSFDATATGTSSFGVLKNVSSSAISLVANVKILYARNDVL